MKEQMESAVTLYDLEMSFQAIADALALNHIKVQKLLITAVCMNQKWQRWYSLPLRSIKKYPYSQLQTLFSFPKLQSPRTCLIKKVCTFRVQLTK